MRAFHGTFIGKFFAVKNERFCGHREYLQAHFLLLFLFGAVICFVIFQPFNAVGFFRCFTQLIGAFLQDAFGRRATRFIIQQCGIGVCFKKKTF